MTYCIVENGIVRNIIVADPLFAQQIGALPYIDGCKIGEAYPHVYSPIELAEQGITDLELANIEKGQQITDLELADIEKGQQITDLELLILGGTQNV